MPLPTIIIQENMGLLSNCCYTFSSRYRYYSFARNPMTVLHLRFIIIVIIMLEYTQARIGYFWHITDLHLDTIYSTQGDVMRSCWRIERQTSSSSAHAPGRYGDYLCDSPWSLIESATRAMKSRQGDNVEFVLWTGDGLSHSAHPMFESKKLEILRNITDLLGRTFSSQFVFPVLGHEDGTTTNFRHMGELWRHWLPSEALNTFEKGGYYSIEQTKSRLRIIALNTNFMRHDPKYSQSHLAAVRQRMPINGNGISESKEFKNFYYHHGNTHQHHGHASDWTSTHNNYGYGNHHRGISVLPNGSLMDGGGRVSALSEFENQDTEKQWTWLKEVLYKSKLNKETVYIVGHIPPGSDERHIGLQQNGHTTFTESNNKRYLDLIRKYSSIIQGQFFGHLHSDSFRIIYDDKGKPVSWMMISPSVTPRKMNVGSNNPAMRLYKFDTDSGQLLDYTQYYMDLQMANTLGEPNWLPEYNLTHYYSLTDISAISLHNFVDRFTSNDGSWFAKYYRANTVRYQTEPCEGVCMLNHYCAITRVDYKEFRQCLEKEQSALRSHATLLQSDDKQTYLLTIVMMLIIMMTMSWNLTYIQHTLIVQKMFKHCDNATIMNCQENVGQNIISMLGNESYKTDVRATNNNATTVAGTKVLSAKSKIAATVTTTSIWSSEVPVRPEILECATQITPMKTITTTATIPHGSGQMYKTYEISPKSLKNLDQLTKQQQLHTCDNCLQQNLQIFYNKTVTSRTTKTTPTAMPRHCYTNLNFFHKVAPYKIWHLHLLQDKQDRNVFKNSRSPHYYYKYFHYHRHHYYNNNTNRFYRIQILIKCNTSLNILKLLQQQLILQHLKLKMPFILILLFEPTHALCNDGSVKLILLQTYAIILSFRNYNCNCNFNGKFLTINASHYTLYKMMPIRFNLSQSLLFTYINCFHTLRIALERRSSFHSA